MKEEELSVDIEVDPLEEASNHSEPLEDEEDEGDRPPIVDMFIDESRSKEL
jgi:hypothetical protein